MLLTLLLHGSMHVTWPIAARIAAVKPAPEGSGLRPLQAWAHTLSDEEVCRMVMVALALQEPTGDPDIERFPGQCVAALGTGVGYVPDEAARITRECIELQLVKHAPAVKKKAKAAKKGAPASARSSPTWPPPCRQRTRRAWSATAARRCSHAWRWCWACAPAWRALTSSEAWRPTLPAASVFS